MLAGKSPHEARIRPVNRVQSSSVSRPVPRQGASKSAGIITVCRGRTAHPQVASKNTACDSDTSSSDTPRPLGEPASDSKNPVKHHIQVSSWSRLPVVECLDDEDSDVFDALRPNTTQLTGRSLHCAPSTNDSDYDDDMRRRRKERGVFETYGDSQNAWNGEGSQAPLVTGDGRRDRGQRRKSDKEQSSRRHLHLFSRLSHEAQLAINETRREMAKQERIIDDADLEDGSSVEIEHVPVVNSSEKQIAKTTPRESVKNGPTDDTACVAHLKSDWRHTGCQLCSCQSRTGLLQKDANVQGLTPRVNKENAVPSDRARRDKGPATAPGKIVDIKNSEFVENKHKEANGILIRSNMNLVKGHSGPAQLGRTNPRKDIKNVEFVENDKVTQHQVVVDEVSSDGTVSCHLRTKLPRIKTPHQDVTNSRGPRLRHHVPRLGPSKIVPFGFRREATTFQITPVGYDCRYDQPLWPGHNDDTPEEVKAKAVQKCSDWIVKYL